MSSFPILELFFLSYFALINIIYIVFLILGSGQVYKRFNQVEEEDSLFLLKSNTLPEILFIVPMHNEAKNILISLYNILNLSYRYKKIIAVNDGSTDDTLGAIQTAFELVEIPKMYTDELPTQEVKKVYQSKRHPEFFLLDKVKGGKADAVNAAINATPTPFFVVLDADTILDNTGFEKLIRPMLSSSKTISVGACIRIINGCAIEHNRVSTARFPDQFYPAMQAIEYLRAFFLREGFNLVNSNYIVSGAFGVFPRDLIIGVGGYSHTVGEDVEIIIRLHRVMKEIKKPYAIEYLPDPIAWTVAPHQYKPLERQRSRWHRGLLETIWHHKKILFNPRYRFFGVIGFPFFLISEGLEPIVEIGAIIYIIFAFIYGFLNLDFLYLVLAVSFGFTSLYSILCLFIEEMTFRKYPSLRSLIVLFMCNFIENIGYRQMTLYWRMKGFVDFFRNLKTTRKETQVIKEKVKRYVDSIKQKGSEKIPS